MFADEILGDFETRYFGAGHKRTNYKLKQGGKLGKAEIIHTNSWSEKMGCSLKPHLSTVDGIILSVMYVEKHMIDERKIDSLNAMFLCAFEIKSGTGAIEDLRDISLTIRKEEIVLNEANFEVVVEGMVVKLKFKKINVKPVDCKQNSEKNAYNYFSEHLKRMKHNIFGIKIEDDEITCTVSREKEDVLFDGIGSRFSNCMSILEWLIVFSQMGQILAYDIDSINRQNSETLWMKNVKAEIIHLIEYQGEISVFGGVTKKNLLNMQDKNWRIFEMAGNSVDGNVRFTGKIAHILPDNKKGVKYA